MLKCLICQSSKMPMWLFSWVLDKHKLFKLSYIMLIYQNFDAYLHHVFFLVLYWPSAPWHICGVLALGWVSQKYCKSYLGGRRFSLLLTLLLMVIFNNAFLETQPCSVPQTCSQFQIGNYNLNTAGWQNKWIHWLYHNYWLYLNMTTKNLWQSEKTSVTVTQAFLLITYVYTSKQPLLYFIKRTWKFISIYLA